MTNSDHVGAVDISDLAKEFPSVEHLAASDGNHQPAWAAVFRARPDVMHAILADYVKHQYAVPGVVGQRPMPREADVDIEDLLRGPELNMRPIHQVLPDIMPTGKTKFARKACMNVPRFNDLLAGRYHPDLGEIRLIATAAGKSPAFFIEYRQLMVIAAMEHLFHMQPNIATSLYRKFVQAHPGAR